MLSTQPQQIMRGEWCWPVDLDSYDRDPSLSRAEQDALHVVIHSYDAGNHHIPKQCRAVLQRLLCPISDVLELTGASELDKKAAVNILLRRMHRNQTSIWAWELDQWYELLCSSSEEFKLRNRRRTGSRMLLMVLSFFLGGCCDFFPLGQIHFIPLAMRIFGQDQINLAIERMSEDLLRWGYSPIRVQVDLPHPLCYLLLLNRSPRLEDLCAEVLIKAYRRDCPTKFKQGIVVISRMLASLGIISEPLSPIPRKGQSCLNETSLEGVAEEWLAWCRRWLAASTLSPRARKACYYQLLKTGRWLMQMHPQVTSPASWTRELAAEYVAAVVNTMKVGQWVGGKASSHAHAGKPLSARAKDRHLYALRVFFRDCQELNWIPRRFDPRRALATPQSVLALIAPDPQIISDDIWAKLLWSGLNLTDEDLHRIMYQTGSTPHQGLPCYPLEMVRAIVVVWLFAGLRSDEIRRLRLGCIRWQREDTIVDGTEEVLSKDAVCWLAVPVNKTGTQFTKAVDRVVGEAIEHWEQVRPPQPAAVDRKTHELVHYLFAYRGRQIGEAYLNHSLIPLLCSKGGIPLQDARGNITSHRARSTIASQLYNAKEPLTLFELQEWLGHQWISSTQSYAKLKPTKVAKSYEKAGYFRRNIRMIEVLIDQETIKSGAAAAGEPWRFYDLGHGYCLYEFFEQCPHRMACAKCSFYCPKGSTQAQLLEGKANLLRMLQEIPLTEEERAAVEDGVAAIEKLCQQLADVPTPAGPTPNQLGTGKQAKSTIIPVERVRRKR